MCKTKHTDKLVLILVCVLTYFLQSCVTRSTLYSWQNYESVTISAMNAGDKHRAKRLSQYKKLIADQKAGLRKMPPPGIFLEYGYELAMSGEIQEGIRMMKQEIHNYPESRIFVEHIIATFEQ